MMKNICYMIVKFFVLFLKKMRIDIFALDKAISSIGKVQISLNRNKYDSVEDIIDIEEKIFSQNGEDGIIDYLIHKLNIGNKNQRSKLHSSKFSNTFFCNF